MNNERKNTHTTIVVINMLIALFLISIPLRRWSDQVHLARVLNPETSGLDIGIKTIRESAGFFLLSLIAIWGSLAEIRRRRGAIWLNIGVPLALLATFAVEYVLHRIDHPEENGIALVITILPISIIFFTYSALYLRDRFYQDKHEP